MNLDRLSSLNDFDKSRYTKVEEGIPEGKIMNSILYRRLVMENKNIIQAIVGPTGSGKTYSGLKICENWYKKKWNKDFPEEYICFSVREVLELLQQGKVQAGDIILLEEIGTSMNARDFQNKISKVFNAVLQTFRNKNIGLIVTLPYLSMLDSQTRKLVHMLIKTVSIDKYRKVSRIKPLWLQWDQDTGKMYKHKPKIMKGGLMEPVEFIELGLCSQQLIEIYEKKKSKFVDSTIDKALNEVMKQETKVNKGILIFTAKQNAVYHAWHRARQEGITDVWDIRTKLTKELGMRRDGLADMEKAMRKRWSTWAIEPYNPSIG